MKKFYLFGILLFLGTRLFAQDYQINGMEYLAGDMTARTYSMTEKPDGGRQCAVLRIATTKITKEQREKFYFSADFASYIREKRIVDGEILLWVSPGIKTLIFKHETLGTYRLDISTYNFEIESNCTYKITMEGLAVPTTEQTGVLSISSNPSGAQLYINGQSMGETPFRSALKYGKYIIELKKESYEDYSEEITLNQNLQGYSPSLIPISGMLSVNSSPSEVKVMIDGQIVGYTPFVTNEILVGTHRLTLEEKGYESEDTLITISKGILLNLKLNLQERYNNEDIFIVEEEEHDEFPIGTSQNLANKTIRTMPSTERTLNDVLQLIPQSNLSASGLAIGGGDYRQSNLTVDGAIFNNIFGIGSNLPANAMPISLDAIQSISYDIAPYDVRENGFIGAAANAVSKRGTNETHVSIYNYFSSNKLIGKEFGNKDEMGHYPASLVIPDKIDNTTGFSIAGPIAKNKLFYFFDLEYTANIGQGQTRFARKNETDPWGDDTEFSRPTSEKMEEIKSYLKSQFNYDPGRYQYYNVNAPDLRLFARLDWNIQDNHKFTLRYTLSNNKYSCQPSSSISPFPSTIIYNRYLYGRISPYALYFESSRYFQEANYSSLVAELNSKSSNNRINNLLRLAYSHQDEPRSNIGGDFPSVDILENIDEDGDGINETPAVYTSFGPDPFTNGNLREAHAFLASDNLTIHSEKNNFLLGIQAEYNNIINSYLQGGLGYFIYDSWDDFKYGNNPHAFAITLGNNPEGKYQAPYFKFTQFSAYMQDEMKLGEKFKLSAGLRMELPVFPSIAERNTNKEFLNGWEDIEVDENGNHYTVHHAIADGSGTSLSGLSTADVPKTRLYFLPRFAFNYDVNDDHSFIIRGSSGLYTGRIPGVWFVSALGNSNCSATQFIDNNYPDIQFSNNPGSLISYNSDILGIGNLPVDLQAPLSPTILDKNLKLPEVWKTGIVFEKKFNHDIVLSFNAVYGKDLSSVTITKLGIKEDGFITLPGEPSDRIYYVSEGIHNSVGATVQPYLLTNAEKNGYNYFFTLQLSKQFGKKFNIIASYIRGQGKNSNDGFGDQVTSAFNTNTYGVNGSNAHELGYASYISPNRLFFIANFTIRESKHSRRIFGLYYNGVNVCSIGNYYYNRYSYTMTSNINGDGGANSLIYIPTKNELASMPFVSDENRDEYENFINNDSYLKSHRGEYAERGGAVAPMYHSFNFRYSVEYFLNDNHRIQIGIDVKNVGNMINRSWGNLQRLSRSDILSWNGTIYQFITPTWGISDSYSTWSAALNIRYSF